MTYPSLLAQLTGSAPLDASTLAELSGALGEVHTLREPEPLLRAALARRGTLADTALARRIEVAVTDHVTASHAGLARMASALQSHWHDALVHPRVLGAAHVALEVDALSPRELFMLLQPLLASEERYGFVLRPHAPLLDRLRAANLCRGVALATGLIGALDAVVGFEHTERFLEALSALYRDPDPWVGARAAWAVGALHSDPRVASLASSSGVTAMMARRALVADVARWQLGELEDAVFLAKLHGGLGKSDPYARAAAILAMPYGAALAPETSHDVVASFVGDASPVVRAAVGAFADSLFAAPARESLFAALRSSSARAEAPALRMWTDEHPLVGALDTAREARAAARRGATAARVAVARTLEAIHAPPAASELSDSVCDAVLLASPLLHDAAAAAGDEGLVRACHARIAEIWSRRVDACLGVGADVSPEGVRGLRRALDAHPRGSVEDEHQLGASAPRHHALVRTLFARLAGSAGELSRPLAGALVAAVEPLVVDERMLHADLVVAALSIESARVLGALAGALTGPAAEAVHALAELRAALDKAPPRAKKTVYADELTAHVRALARGASTLGPPGGSLVVATEALLAAAAATASRAPTTLELWREAYLALRLACASTPLVDAEAGASTSEPEIVLLLRSVLVAAKLAAPDPGRSLTSAAKASRRWNAALPAALAGLLEAVLAAEPRAKPQDVAHGPVFVGKRIGDYVVVRVLGSGAMGHCVLVHRRLEAKSSHARTRHWVLKLPQRTDLVGLFRDEALALIQLSEQRHPGIVRFVSFVDYGTRLPFLVMDYVEGESLEQRIARGRGREGIAHDELVAVGVRIASALATSHAMGICHYDLKPANVVLGMDGAVIVDWGLAGAAMPNAGTPEYMAPERFDADVAPSSEARRAVTAPYGTRQASGSSVASIEVGLGAADVFALGCVLVEMASGAPLVTCALTEDDTREHPRLGEALGLVGEPFRRSYGCAAVVRNPDILAGRARRALAGADPRLTELTLACLSSDPAARPTAADVARRLVALTIPADT